MKRLRAQNNETKLEKATRLIVNYHLSGYNDPPLEGFVNDLQHGGCGSGMIGELIYYHDTVKFYLKHRDDINKLLQENLDNYGTGASMDALFGDKWDASDPLALDTLNQSLLAWFGFETTAFQLIRDAGVDF